MLKRTELKRVIPLPGARVVWLGGDQVAAGHQLVALDGSVVVNGPFVFFESFGVVLDTNNQTDAPRWCGTQC